VFEKLAAVRLHYRPKQIRTCFELPRQRIGRQLGVFSRGRADDSCNAVLWKSIGKSGLALMPGRLRDIRPSTSVVIVKRS